METQKCSCSINENENKLEFVFSGRMETSFINEEMEKILAKIKECNKDVNLNLAGVDYISSSFLRLCVIASKCDSTGKRKMLVTNLTPSVKKVFKIAKFDAMIEE